MQVPDTAPFRASPWASEDSIYCLDKEGKTFVIQPGREFRVLAVNRLDDKICSSVAVGKETCIFRSVNYLWGIKK
jgi:hypothetical protein